MRKFAWAFVVCVVIIAATGVSAKTPDGVTPSQESICDNEEGAAYGLCVAYCEAMDCTDPNQRSSDRACEVVGDHYAEKTGGRMLPCLVQCPCFEEVGLFADILSGQAIPTQCTVNNGQLFVVVDTDEDEEEEGDFVLVQTGEMPGCGVNTQIPTRLTDPMQALACRIKLIKLVEAMGTIECTFSE